MFNFKNDYSEGAHQKVLEAIAAINLEGNVGYGADPYCERAADMIREKFGCPDAAVHFFIGGTSAISKTGENSIRSLGAATERIGGANRYDTSTKICTKYAKLFTGKGIAVAAGTAVGGDIIQDQRVIGGTQCRTSGDGTILHDGNIVIHIRLIEG